MQQSVKYAKEVINSVTERLSGKDYAFIWNKKPSEEFFIGTLNELAKNSESRIAKTGSSINATGMMLQVNNDHVKKGQIKVKLLGAYYYRVFPEYNELQALNRDDIVNYKSERVKIPLKFKKKYFETERIIDLKDIISDQFKETSFGFITFCNGLAKTCLLDPMYFVYENRRQTDTFPQDILNDADSYQKFILELGNRNAPVPQWNFSLETTCSKSLDTYIVRIILRNLSVKSSDRSIDNTIFETNLSLTPLNFEPTPFELNSISSEYSKRDDRLIKVTGINSAITEINGTYETEHAPRYSWDSVEQSLSSVVNITELLSDHWEKVLTNIHRELELLNADYYSRQSAADLTPDAIERLNRDKKRSEEEIRRFRNGITSLVKNEVAFRAFHLMNKSFLNSRKKITSWRPFQIIFIVSIIPDLVQDETLVGNYRNSADLLYFPTGGGKTEAFLGLAVFQAFLDRLQGKKAGVSVFVKFPLRMLSAQQLQRIADILSSAEIVRAEEIGGDAEAFSVGYYVGEGNTPNKLVDSYKGKDVLSQIEASPESGKKWQIIQICPFCGNSTIKIKSDKERIRLMHFCVNEGCIGALPIYISDTEIYRYLPTVVVSTIDKMVTMGIQPNFRNILGEAHYKCKRHGFAPTNRCIEDSCSDRNNLEQISQEFDMSPSLLIQDEIHLLKESFGTLDSHYETGLDQLVLESTNGKKNLKVICSSATVSKDYESEIGQIYQRDIIKFPINYEIFTKRIKEKPQRIIVGLMPHSKTLINAIERALIETFKSLNDKYPLLSNDPSSSDLYRVVLTYHNKKDDANALNRSVTTRISKELEEAKYPPVGKHKLTGDEPFDKVKDVMGQIEGNNFAGTLIATSLVSHGIDLEQLNTMIFMGMPGNNAEYIQALSRVGRKLTSTGIVFVLFNPWRERDQSYYTNFSKFHELIELVIEGTPINRWAEDAVKITLPGLFCSYIYNVAASKPGLEDVIKPFGFADHYEKKDITKEDILNFLNESYRVSASPDPGRFSELLDQQVENMVSHIIDYRQDRMSLIGFKLKPHQPLTNFRSISQPVKLILDTYTERVVQDIDFSRGETE